MEENKNNKKKIIIIVGILVLVSVIGGTLAYFMARATSSEQTITSANLKIVFDDSTPIINATDIEPIEEDDILTNAAKKTFRISKESNTGKDLYARIDMIDLNISDNFKDYDLKWALYEGTNKITTGTFVPTKDGSTSINMATNVLLNNTTPKEYNLYIWINETRLEQISLMDGSLKGKISVTAEAKKLNTLASNILSETVKDDAKISEWKEEVSLGETSSMASASNKTIATDYVLDEKTGYYKLSGTIIENASYSSEYINYYTHNNSNKSGIKMFKIKAVDGNTVTQRDVYTSSVISTDKGLYVQKEDNERSEFGFPSYYYRGSVENNYVQLGTYKNDVTNVIGTPYEEDGVLDYDSITNENIVVAHKNDPILWRIVRINEDGSIRLIAEHNIEKHRPFDDFTDGNRSPEYIDGNDNDIKNVVDNWYANTITESNINNKIQIGNFCNDITRDSDGKYQAWNRIMNWELNPIFKCPNGAIVANEKAGLITADEIIFSGIYKRKAPDNITYLYNKTSFWTMTPASSTDVFNFERIDINSTIVNLYNHEARPVINLKSDVTINRGTGTKDDPYIIQ